MEYQHSAVSKNEYYTIFVTSLGTVYEVKQCLLVGSGDGNDSF